MGGGGWGDAGHPAPCWTAIRPYSRIAIQLRVGRLYARIAIQPRVGRRYGLDGDTVITWEGGRRIARLLSDLQDLCYGGDCATMWGGITGARVFSSGYCSSSLWGEEAGSRAPVGGGAGGRDGRCIAS